MHNSKAKNVFHSKMNAEPNTVENNTGKTDFGRPGNSFADETPF
jgi:hypothetical protein